MIKINTNIPTVFKKAVTGLSGIFRKQNNILKPLPNDVFIKTENEAKIVSEATIKELYDEIYDEIIAQNTENNPILKEITINKPEILFEDKSNDNKLSYSSYDNKIKVNSDFLKQDFYAVLSYDKNNEIKNTYGICEKQDLNSAIKEIKKKDSKVQAIKLNEDEKYIQFRCALAHEIRHCIQNHLILSCENGHKEFKDEIMTVIKQLGEFRERIINNGGDSSQADSEIEKYQNFYILTYKPNKILDKDAVFKLSMDKNDNRYWSIYDDFVNLDPSYYSNYQFDEDKYYSSNIEIDAYNYEYDYYMKNLENFSKTNARNDVLITLIEICYEKANYKNKFSK